MPCFSFRFRGTANMTGLAAGLVPVENDPQQTSDVQCHRVRLQNGRRNPLTRKFDILQSGGFG